MSTAVHISDDGDEVVLVSINGDTVAKIDHGTYGWAGMEEVINLVKALGDAYGFEVYDNQDIV